jgi:membrane-associated phospholipid phosphatase
MFLFDVFWTEVLRLTMPWSELFFRVITIMGSDFFYLILIAIDYWIVNKRASILTTYVLIISVVSNYWLKIIIRYPRPPETNWLLGVEAVNYSLPSGHSQSSVIFWGWLSAKIKTWWMGVLSASLIVLVGLSRIYIGVHWLGDVIIGWAVGLLLLFLLLRLEAPTRFFLMRFKPVSLYLGLIVFGIASMILTEFLSPVRIVGLEDNFGANGGLIMGLGIGLALERKYVNFETSPKHVEKLRVALRAILGLILVFTIMIILSPILPSDVYWLRSIRYALVTVFVMFLWPFFFDKLAL